MAASQNHGLLFEATVLNEVVQRLGPAGAPPPGMPSDPTARFDLPAWRDPTRAGIPTSIKMTKRRKSGKNQVDMADARRTVSLADVPMWRLLVGLYDQVGNKKEVREVREYLIPMDIWIEVTGDIPPHMVSRFHEALKKGSPAEARQVAAQWKTKMTQHSTSVLKWAAKIDSKTQRRLQCSLPLDQLEALMLERGEGEIRVYGTTVPPAGAEHLRPVSPRLWGGLGTALPLVFDSPPRARKPRAAEAVA